MMSYNLLVYGALAGLANAGTATAPQQGDIRQGPRNLDVSSTNIGSSVLGISGTGLDGADWTLSSSDRPTVVFLTNTTCPLCLKFAPKLARIEDSFKSKVNFVYVNASSAEPAGDMVASVKKFGYDGPYIHDAGGSLVKRLKAGTTTDAFLISDKGKVVYRGAVDDQYGLGYALAQPKQNLLIDAIDAELSGKTPDVQATWAPGCVLEELEVVEAKEITYSNQVSRILNDACGDCHRDGGVAPFKLDNYKDVKDRAAMIKFVTENRLMPPWFASDAGKGDESIWANDHSLTSEEIAVIADWVDNKMPEGDPSEMPSAKAWPSEWKIGEPDQIFQISNVYEIPAEGTVDYKHTFIKTDFKEDKWVDAFEIMPTDPSVVHHVLVFVVEPDEDGRLRLDLDESSGFLAGYVPGLSSIQYADGLAKKVPAGAVLAFQMHYTTNGTATTDQTRLGLTFRDTPPEHEVKTIGVANTRFKIPPGADNHSDGKTITLPNSVKILSYLPHMHVRGKAFRYEATLPGGEKKMLLDVPRYDFNWQLSYELKEPQLLPKGSELKVTAWFDNSDKNPANPDPTKTVGWGPQTWHEMLLGYIEYYEVD